MTFRLRDPRATRKCRVLEKTVQADIVQLLRSVGAAVYILGTRRPTGDHQGTCMTPGIGDVYCFLPPRRTPHWVTLWVEAKAKGGRLSPDQKAFQEFCHWAHHHHIVGGLDDVVKFLQSGGWLKAA